MDFRTDRIRNKHGWFKIHVIIDVGTKVVLTYLVTTSHTADIKGLYDMLDDLLHGPCSIKGRDFCLDAAYLSLGIYNRLAGMGMTPLIKPKSNTVHNTNGSQAWRKMVDMYHDYDLPAFNARYHQRSVRGSVCGHQEEDVRQLCQVPQARQPTTRDPNALNLLQHRADRTVTSRKWQAHTPVT